MKNVINLVVQKDRCIGCSVCAGICPADALEMKFNESGNLQPVLVEKCLEKCDICLKNCPFNEIISTEQGLGNFVKTYEFSLKNDEKRLKSASGGAGNYILTEILKRKLADKIISVRQGEKYLFEFGVFDDLKSLEMARSSAYYPVDFSKMVRYILSHDETYVITTLPCLARSLRLLQKNNFKFRKRVKFIISLVCGGTKSANFTQKCADIAFVRKNIELEKVNFREKISDKNALNFAFKFTSKNGETALFDRFKNIDFWNLRAFTPLACNNCNDTFATHADITLMDAWLDKNIDDFRGTSLIILRNETLFEIFENCKENLAEISPENVLKAQLGVAKNKELFFSKKGNFIERKILKIKLEIQKYSAENYDCEDFIRIRLKKLNFWVKLDAKIKTAKYLIKKILGIKQ